MTEAAIYEQVSGIRGQLLDLITAVRRQDAGDSAHGARTDLVLDVLLVLANGLGRIEAGLGGTARL